MLIIMLGNDSRLQMILLDQLKASVAIVTYHFCKVHKPTRIKLKRRSMKIRCPNRRLNLDGKTYR
jgi:hypothetical protein